ncbi:hypothetical protein [Poriferisphaera sp. WC338]|uniref:hypothetical protein n=1 Tax=Poriferisphaera sp. WC338 TaxID=3425129 RepID=UPI003D8194FB
MPAPAKTPRNKHGRKPGRGLRPWLLIPKILCFCLLVGSLAALGLLCLRQVLMPESINIDPYPEIVPAQTYLDLTGQIEQLVKYLIIPSATLTIFFGILLLIDAPRIFIKLRWLQIKTLLVIITLPLLHITTRIVYEGYATVLHSNLQQMDLAVSNDLVLAVPLIDTWVADSLDRYLLLLGTISLLGVIALAAIILIGRLKPKLWQNWAKAYPRK